MENKPRTIGLRVAAGVIIAITIIVAVFASGIQLPSKQIPSKQIDTGQLTVLLKDAPVDVDELWITITSLEIHRAGEDDGEWLPIDFSTLTDELTFNLLEYQDDKVLPLADVEIAVGSYNKIRMNVTSAEAWYYLEVDENGAPIDDDSIDKVALKVPSEHIDVITKFNITSTENVVVLIDMQPNWVSISNSNNLRPVLKASVSQQPQSEEGE
jgi:hypothetical protein